MDGHNILCYYCAWKSMIYIRNIKLKKYLKNLLYKDKKPSVWSVCLSVLTTLITLPSRNISTPDMFECKPLLLVSTRLFRKVFTTASCCLWHFECQGEDDSSQNFTYIPAKLQPRHN